MRVLITGGSGYIGSRVMQQLAERTEVQEIINIDLRLPQQPLPKVQTIQRDVSQELSDLFQRSEGAIDLAIHAAWVVDPLRDAIRQRNICIGGTQNFLAGCRAGKVKHILFISSATAYGAYPGLNQLLDEFAPLRSQYHFQYSAEKREAEALFQNYAEDHPETLLQIVRPVVVAGPNVSNFIFRAITKPVVFMAQGHNPAIQLVHEDDVAAAIAAIILSRVPGPFNLAADGSVPLRQIYQRLGASQIVSLPLPLLLTVANWVWKLNLQAIAEAPAGLIYFTTYPWLVANQRVQQTTNFRFQYTTEQVIDSCSTTPIG
ncbi:MAG: NAD-dependent epimerase/dehydratase family protein [Kovacikia sp.]